ncbi:MAG: hypothetical protein PVJ21_05770 [Anaerolineales bacterium]|jgi:hypothetical protein
MAEEIKCPMCGKPNPAELDVCQYCEARLKPVTDELARSQPPIHPGEEPTDQDTSDLEPILPQWLRDIRQQSRDSAEDAENDESAEQAPAEKEAPQPEPEEPADLLAGLQSQADEDDEIPDWLAGLRSETGQIADEEESTEEDDLAALKSMLGEDAPTSEKEESQADDIPSWMSDLGTQEPTQLEQPPASSADLEWGADFEAESPSQADSMQDEAPIDTGLPAWLQGADEPTAEEDESFSPAEITPEEPAPASEGELPDWLASLGEEETESVPQQETDQPIDQSAPDWMSSLEEETAEGTPEQDIELSAESTPDWLASLGDDTPEAESERVTPQLSSEDEIPDWISSLGSEDTESGSQPFAEEPADVEEVPDWAAPIEEESVEEFPVPQPSDERDLPDWLSSLGEEGSTQEEDELLATSSESPDTAQPAAQDELPDWLSSMGEETVETEQPVESDELSTVTPDKPTPSFVDDEGKPISTEDVESIFNMDMPDWLTDTESIAEGDEAAPVGAQADELDPGELPSWVQAMRPVESVISETEDEPIEEQPVEEQGPLAGLRGVLPAVPGVGPSSTPKAYAIRLEASAEQQANATLLERLLAEEVHPKPVSTQKAVTTQRILRWVIAVLVILVVGGTVFSGMQINPMPTSAPLETSAALNYIQSSLPTDAPVLLIFDYEAAFAGEIEAAAAPFIDHMLTLKAPRLSLISSTPTGTGLAERLMAIEQDSHNYERNQQFVNLGYLPGSAAGILAFSESPVSTKPLTTTGENAWETPALQGVGNLSDFAAIILLTNDIETARIWIEQTENARGEARLLVISSAQSGPMIQPYYQSGQVDGMITGLGGSAPIERVNSGRPGMVRRYWDAYGFGLLMAAAIIVLGSLWSLFAGWQASRNQQGEA